MKRVVGILSFVGILFLDSSTIIFGSGPGEGRTGCVSLLQAVAQIGGVNRPRPRPRPQLRQAPLRNFQNFTNIQMPRLRAAPAAPATPVTPQLGRPELAGDIPYFVYDSATGKVRQHSEDGNIIREFENMDSFKSEFDLNQSYFPLVFDTQRPNQLIFGIGDGAIHSSGQPVQNTLIRNGGHFQLARQYRGNPNPDLQGLAGGGLKFGQDGTPTIELTSRSVNRSSDGKLEAAQEAELKGIIGSLFIQQPAELVGASAE